MHIAITASDVSAAAINHVDGRVAANDDTIAQPHVDAAANMDPAATHGGAPPTTGYTTPLPSLAPTTSLPPPTLPTTSPPPPTLATPSSEQGP